MPTFVKPSSKACAFIVADLCAGDALLLSALLLLFSRATKKSVIAVNSKLSLPEEILSSIERALKEDIGPGDITTSTVVPADTLVEATVIAKQAGVVAGLEVTQAVFLQVDSGVDIRALLNDGDYAESGQPLLHLQGNARAILTAERTALNFLGRMSGIATLTRQFVDAIRGTTARILDTRKTAPNLRAFDKWAVRLGGGENHRLGLYDMVLIKDNHIDCAGSLTEAVRRARAGSGNVALEVEARTLADVAQCLNLGVDWIMLDNMSLEDMRSAVALNQGRAKLEASGNVTLRNVREIAETGIDYISVGALTHSPAAFDVSLIVNWASKNGI